MPRAIYAPVVSIRDQWPGIKKIQNIVVFGDSYSAPVSSTDLNKPWAEYFVSHLSEMKPCAQVVNVAKPGHSIEDQLESQLHRFFQRFPEIQSHNAEPPLDPHRTLIVLQMGINDCGTKFPEDFEDIIDILIDALDRLYIKAGARNFVVFDVPPLERSPDGQSVSRAGTTCELWNELLQSKLQEWTDSTSQASLLNFSIHAFLNDVLDAPEKYGFDADDVRVACGKFWMDGLHLTTAVHQIMAMQVYSELAKRSS